MSKRIVVIGGGITGLCAANHLSELNRQKNLDIEILLIEKSERLGGPIQTIRKDGFLVELGPDMFFTRRPWALDLCGRLGLEKKLIKTNESKRGTYILINKRLIPVPEGFLMLAPSKIFPFLKSSVFSWPGKLRMMLDLFIPRGKDNDESLASFVRRRLGNEALEKVAQPMIGGIYTSDPEKLSIKATTPQFVEMERKYGSVIVGMLKNSRENRSDSGARYSQFLSFKNGMCTIIDGLKENLPEGTINLEETVNSIRRGPQNWIIETSKRGIDALGVIIAAPSYIAANLVENIDPELASDLNSIEYASSAVVILAYRIEQISLELNGFGFVVPDVEKSDLIACSFSSIKFDGRTPEGCVLLRAFVGGALNPDICDLDDQDIIQKAEMEVSSILGIKGNPIFKLLQRYPRAMPQYHVGHLELVDRIRKKTTERTGLILAGNAYDGVGIPECVHSGETAAEQVVKDLFS